MLDQSNDNLYNVDASFLKYFFIQMLKFNNDLLRILILWIYSKFNIFGRDKFYFKRGLLPDERYQKINHHKGPIKSTTFFMDNFMKDLFMLMLHDVSLSGSQWKKKKE